MDLNREGGTPDTGRGMRAGHAGGLWDLQGARRPQGLEDIGGIKWMVERKGIEPSTFALRTRRSPN